MHMHACNVDAHTRLNQEPDSHEYLASAIGPHSPRIDLQDLKAGESDVDGGQGRTSYAILDGLNVWDGFNGAFRPLHFRNNCKWRSL